MCLGVCVRVWVGGWVGGCVCLWVGGWVGGGGGAEMGFFVVDIELLAAYKLNKEQYKLNKEQ